MSVRWVVQNNFRTDADDPNWIRKACEKFGLVYEGFKVVPFSDSIPRISDDMPTVFYGGTGWINKIYKSNPKLPGIFFNPQSTFDYWIGKYKEKALNYGARITTFQEISKELFPDDQMFFVRPTSDQKEFSGSIMSFGDIKDWCKKIFTDAPDLGNLPIVLGEPFVLSHEWRLFIVDGKVCTGSQYRTYFVRNTSPNVPEKVIRFAEEQAAVYSPKPIFVMDICETSGNLYVIEIGCINSAGFYEASIDKIVTEVSNYLLRTTWQEKLVKKSDGDIEKD